jgi:ABC-type taurine transport system ATPase subunit
MARASIVRALGLAAVMLLLSEPAAAQCAMCRRALQSPEGQQVVAAFRSGILVLLATPFALVGGVAALVVRMQRRRRASAQGPERSLASRARKSSF